MNIRQVCKSVGLFLAAGTLLLDLACKKSPPPPEEKVENIQNFTATSSTGADVTGTHTYSLNGASGALGSPVSVGFTTKNSPITSDITVTGNGVIGRVYSGVSIYGTQNRTDKLSANGRYNAWEWIIFMGGKNRTWNYPGIELTFYERNGWVVPQSFRNAFKAQFEEFAKDNPLITGGIKLTDGGVYPGTYTPKDGVIVFLPDDESSNITNSPDNGCRSGRIWINKDFDSAVMASIPDATKDFVAGEGYQNVVSLEWDTIKMGSAAWVEGRVDFDVRNINEQPMEYQNGFSGSTTHGETIYVTLQIVPGQGFMSGNGDGAVPDNEKMVVGRRYGENPEKE